LSLTKSSKIFIAGHRGLAGSAISRALRSQGYENLLEVTRTQLDLTQGEQVSAFLEKEKPDVVILAAAKVGGIHANNTYPAEFIYENLQIQNNVIHQSYVHKVKKLLFLGSSCIYPKYSPQPLKEEYLLSGHLEPTNESYAVAKIAGIEMCRSYRRQYGCNFICAMPTNLYGPNDNFHLEKAHVLPALIHRFHIAKETNQPQLTLWGTGKPYREFLFSEDLGDACVFLLNNYNEPDIINVGTGVDVAIKELAETIQKIVGYEGEIQWDSSKPDGTPRKLLDVSRIADLNWKAKTNLEEGIKLSYQWFLENFDTARK